MKLVEKSQLTKEEFEEIYCDIVYNEFGYYKTTNKNLLFYFTKSITYDGKIAFNYNTEKSRFEPEYIVFSDRVLKMKTNKIKNIIRHELIHWYVLKDFENNTEGVYKLLFPHGYYFIKECIKRKVPYWYYILTLGLSGFNWKILTRISLINNK